MKRVPARRHDGVAHLVKRFIGSLSGAPPSAVHESWARAQLLEGEVKLWVQMSNADRRHAIDVARRFEQVRGSPSRSELAAALLHDVGKIVADLGTVARVVATVVGPRTERFRVHHDHERLGAQLLERAGSTSATVELVQRRGPAATMLGQADQI